MKEQFEEIKKIPAFAIFFFLIFPFLFSPYFQDEDLYVKNLAFSVFTSILAFVSLKKKEAMTLNRSSANSMLLFLLLLGSMLFSYSRIINTDEGLATLLQILMPVLFLFVSIQNRSRLGVQNWAALSSYTIILLSVMVIAQILYRIVFLGIFVVDFSIRATLSNKNFVSEVIILLLPFSLSGVFSEEKTKNRLSVFGSIAGLVTILVLQSVSAWLVIVISTALFLPLYLRLFNEKLIQPAVWKKWKLFIGAFVFFAVVLFYFTGFLKPVNKKIESTAHYFNTDFNEMISKNDSSNVNSVYERFLLWRNSIKLGKEYPLTGVGLSNWKFLYPKYGIGGAYHLNSGAMHFEHPHNEFLLFFSETGLISIITFLLVLIYILMTAVKRFKNADGKMMYLMFCGIISFIILSQFSYPLHRPYATSLLMLMFAVILTGRETKKEIRIPKWLNLLILLISLFVVRVQFARAVGNYHISSALHDQAINRFPKMLQDLRKAENDYYSIDNTGTPINWYKGFAHYYTGSDSSLYYFKLAEDQNPFHLQILSDIGASYENLGDHAKAMAYFNKVISITPLFPSAHLNLAIAQYNLGSLDSALMNINQSHVGSEYERKVLITILSSMAKQISDSISDKNLKGCLDRFSQNDSILIKSNKLALKDKLQFRQLLLKKCSEMN